MKYIIFANFTALLLLVSVSFGLLQYQSKDQEEFESLRLQYAINKATDASVLGALTTTTDVGYDYSDKRVTLNPETALKEFVDSLLFSYGLEPSALLRAEIRGNYLPIFTVAVFDGFYVAQPTMIKASANVPENAATDVDWDMTFAPKMPYTYRNGGQVYALNLGANYYLRLAGAAVEKVVGLPPGLATKEAVVAEINKVLSTELSVSMDKFNANNPSWKNTFYIPTKLTDMTRTNPVSSESVIALVQGMNLTTVTPLSAFSVGGSRVSDRRLVTGYVRNGIKYYSYSDQSSQIIPAITVDDVYSTIVEAAADGYTADLTNLAR